jgi:hypothetical protein
MITLTFDLYVKDNNGTPSIIVKNKDHTIRTRGAVADKNLVPTGFYPLEYTWDPNVSFSVPKGYSILITHPLNRNDLPFYTLSGIIDTVYENIYHIILGKYFSAAQLGFYTRALSIRQLPVINISSALNKVTYPLFSSIQNDDQRLKVLYKRVMQQVLYWIAPILIISNKSP